MRKEDIKKLLEAVSNGEVAIDKACDDLKNMPFEDMGFAKLDHHRHLRNDFSEVIFCRGKTTEQVVSIARRMSENGANVLGTRCEVEAGLAILNEFGAKAFYDEISGVVGIKNHAPAVLSGSVAVLSAGTADMKVSEEARLTLEFFGAKVERFYDVGVAGLHRLLAHVKELGRFNALIVVAGMEGALPSVVGGLVSSPVIAVPTSVGYGTNFSGVTPLFAMLNSCSEGISVVNIDNGFGAACAALRILRSNK